MSVDLPRPAPRRLAALSAWAVSVAASASVSASATPAATVPATTAVSARRLLAVSSEPPRVKIARQNHGAVAKALFVKAHVAYPPGAMLLRAFKGEDLLELWAGASPRGPLTLVQTYKVCARSGGPGPKRKAGDYQVPEGFYSISTLNPYSSYHLSLQVDYPNAADRARGKKAGVKNLGGDIFIHGQCVTIGCLPITDGPIEELFVIATDARAHGAKVAAHLFPARPGTAAWSGLLGHTADAGLRAFWESLVPPFDAFERSHLLPAVQATADGRYSLQR